MASPSLPRYRCHSLAPRGDRCQNRARMARPRVTCDDAKIPRTLEGNGKAAGRNEIAVLRTRAGATVAVSAAADVPDQISWHYARRLVNASLPQQSAPIVELVFCGLSD